MCYEYRKVTYFPEEPVIRAVGKEDWVILIPFTNRYTGVHIKQGFRFDGASIPRCFWRVAGHPMMGDVLPAALEHDAMYASHVVSKKEADNNFLANMKRSGVGFFKRRLFYWSVKYFGGSSYRRKPCEIESALKYVSKGKADLNE